MNLGVGSGLSPSNAAILAGEGGPEGQAASQNESGVNPVVWGIVGIGTLGLVVLAVLFGQAVWERNQRAIGGSELARRPSSHAEARYPQEASTNLHVGLEEERRKLEELRRQYEEMIAVEEKRRQEEEERRRREEEERRRKEEEARAIEEARQRQLLLQQMGRATSRAWRELQQVEAKIKGTEAPQSEICRLAASQYAQIDLTGVDPDLVQHVEDLVAVYRDGINIWKAYEADMQQIEEAQELFLGIGAIAGAAAEPRNPQAGALAGGLMLGLATLPAVAEAKKNVEDRHKSTLNQWWKRLNAVYQREEALASELGERYRTTFIDAL